MTQFTSDWFTHIIGNFQAVKNHLGTVDSILEIGVYEGRSTCWMLENLLSEKGNITCIDPFLGEDAQTFSFDKIEPNREIETRFRQNTQEVRSSGQTVDLMVSRSYTALAQLITEKRQFDFIYLDGNHTAPASLTDACMCFGLLKSNGIMLIDDYLWENVEDHLDRCKMSIDAFVNLFGKLLRVGMINYQVAILKR